MSTAYALPSTCRQRRENRQRGMVSLVILCLMLVVIFLGMGLFYFARQGAESVQQYREEMRMRLAAEGAVEDVWANVNQYEDAFAGLREGRQVSLPYNNQSEGLKIKIYALLKQEKIYIIATVFRQQDELDRDLEPHCIVKGVLIKVRENGKTYYKWLGWTA